MHLFLSESGRQDLNLRPLDPQSNALAKLRYAPETSNFTSLRNRKQQFLIIQIPTRNKEMVKE